jgi:hypothetical protein
MAAVPYILSTVRVRVGINIVVIQGAIPLRETGEVLVVRRHLLIVLGMFELNVLVKRALRAI